MPPKAPYKGFRSLVLDAAAAAAAAPLLLRVRDEDAEKNAMDGRAAMTASKNDMLLISCCRLFLLLDVLAVEGRLEAHCS